MCLCVVCVVCVCVRECACVWLNEPHLSVSKKTAPIYCCNYKCNFKCKFNFKFKCNCNCNCIGKLAHYSGYRLPLNTGMLRFVLKDSPIVLGTLVASQNLDKLFVVRNQNQLEIGLAAAGANDRRQG